MQTPLSDNLTTETQSLIENNNSEVGMQAAMSDKTVNGLFNAPLMDCGADFIDLDRKIHFL